MELWRLPEVLVVQLKRFGVGRQREKNSALVRFPISGLDLSGHVLDTRRAADEPAGAARARPARQRRARARERARRARATGGRARALRRTQRASHCVPSSSL